MPVTGCEGNEDVPIYHPRLSGQTRPAACPGKKNVFFSSVKSTFYVISGKFMLFFQSLEPLTLNDLLHSAQECGFSPVWVITWAVRLLAWLNDFGHLVHLCGFSPVWVRKWELRLSARLNDLLHLEHLWGFSPLWMSTCLLKSEARPNDLLQLVQMCNFSPLCFSWWFLRCPACLNDLLHCLQEWSFSPVWVNIWVFRFPTWLNDGCNWYKCATFPRCASADDSSEFQLPWMTSVYFNKKWAVISEIASLYHIDKKLWNDVITTFILVSRVQETEKKHKFSRNYIKSWLDRGKKHIFFPGQAAGRVCP